MKKRYGAKINSGYLVVTFIENKKLICRLVSRLVAENFIENDDIEKNQIHHINYNHYSSKFTPGEIPILSTSFLLILKS